MFWDKMEQGGNSRGKLKILHKKSWDFFRLRRASNSAVTMGGKNSRKSVDRKILFFSELKKKLRYSFDAENYALSIYDVFRMF